MMEELKQKCNNCGKIFKRVARKCPEELKKRLGIIVKNTFCCQECHYNYSREYKQCGWCGKDLVVVASYAQKSKSGHNFCNGSCSASYNNTKRRKSRRSKMEIMLFEMIKEEFPELDIIDNDKELLDGYELDIAIPSLNFAIEWNGIVHFEPIYGKDKLDNIKQRDLDKKIKARENQIELMVIPDLVSTEKYVKEAFQEVKKRIKFLLSN